mmetsp:Transcript_18882/g.28018  ORF Transcript_18882/g.28018 Transcript_18882/m.28018 type:complete len:115 (+) Transcript_18882:171-515(+)
MKTVLNGVPYHEVTIPVAQERNQDPIIVDVATLAGRVPSSKVERTHTQTSNSFDDHSDVWLLLENLVTVQDVLQDHACNERQFSMMCLRLKRYAPVSLNSNIVISQLNLKKSKR